MGYIDIVALFTLIFHGSFGIELDVWVDQIHGYSDIQGMGPYELLSHALFIFVELLNNVFTVIIKLSIILARMITTCIDLFTKTLVVIQSSS